MVAWTTLAWTTLAWASPDAFRTLQLEGFIREVPVSLFPQGDGSVLALHADGSARTYWPDGRSIEEVLPVRYAPPILPPLARAKPNLFLRVAAKPHYRPSSPYSTLLESFENLIPWDQQAGGELVRPWLLRVRHRSSDWFGHVPRFHGKAPVNGPLPFELESCRGGALVLLEDGLVRVRFEPGETWHELSARALLPPSATLEACEVEGDTVRAVFEVDPVQEQARLEELVLRPGAAAEKVEEQVRPVASTVNAAVSEARAELPGHDDLDGCYATHDDSSVAFAWFRDERVLTVLARDAGSYVPIAHVEGTARLACQQGGRGLFVASGRGLYLVTADDGLRAVLGRAPVAIGLPRLPPSPMRRPTTSSLIPNRIQLLGSYTHRAQTSDEQWGQGGPFIRFTQGEHFSTRWDMQLVLQWDFGAAADPVSREAEAVRRLAVLPAQMVWADTTSAPSAAYPSTIHRQAAEEVFDSLHQILEAEE